MKSQRITDVEGLSHLYQVENFYFAGQPSAASLEEMKKRGVKRVINLRSLEEMDFSGEKKFCEELGLDYIALPLMDNGSFNGDNVKKLNDLLGETRDPEFIHCGSANRVAGWSITYFVDKKGMSFDEAVELAENSGLSSFSFVDAAKRYLAN